MSQNVFLILRCGVIKESVFTCFNIWADNTDEVI